MEGYSVKVVESSKQLTAREIIKLKDLTNAVSLDSVVEDDSPMMLTPDFWAELHVHNEKSKDKDYKKYVIIDKGGNKYHTGSESFFNAFMDIASEMAEAAPDEEYTIEVYRRPSKNYAGKSFLTCSLM